MHMSYRQKGLVDGVGHVRLQSQERHLLRRVGGAGLFNVAPLHDESTYFNTRLGTEASPIGSNVSFAQ